MTKRHRAVKLKSNDDLEGSGHDLGSGVGVLRAGASEYEFWRSIKRAHLPALRVALGGRPDADLVAMVTRRFRTDVELDEFATANGIPTEFSSWISTDWND
jgi:hypothetical protein